VGEGLSLSIRSANPSPQPLPKMGRRRRNEIAGQEVRGWKQASDTGVHIEDNDDTFYHAVKMRLDCWATSKCFGADGERAFFLASFFFGRGLALARPDIHMMDLRMQVVDGGKRRGGLTGDPLNTRHPHHALSAHAALRRARQGARPAGGGRVRYETRIELSGLVATRPTVGSPREIEASRTTFSSDLCRVRPPLTAENSTRGKVAWPETQGSTMPR